MGCDEVEEGVALFNPLADLGLFFDKKPGKWGADGSTLNLVADDFDARAGGGQARFFLFDLLDARPGNLLVELGLLFV